MGGQTRMAEFKEGQGSKKQAERDVQKKEDRFTSLMFGNRRDNKGQTSQQHSEPNQLSPTIDYDELMTNIDTLLDSVRGLKPLFSKVYPYFQQLWKKK
jgi:hypothetical protein